MKRVYDKKKLVMACLSNFILYFCTLLKEKDIKKHSKMPPIVVSRNCVQKGNSATSRNKRISLDGGNVSVQSRTFSGYCKMTFSREAISTEAKKAFCKVVRK